MQTFPLEGALCSMLLAYKKNRNFDQLYKTRFCVNLTFGRMSGFLREETSAYYSATTKESFFLVHIFTFCGISSMIYLSAGII